MLYGGSKLSHDDELFIYPSIYYLLSCGSPPPRCFCLSTAAAEGSQATVDKLQAKLLDQKARVAVTLYECLTHTEALGVGLDQHESEKDTRVSPGRRTPPGV